MYMSLKNEIPLCNNLGKICYKPVLGFENFIQKLKKKY